MLLSFRSYSIWYQCNAHIWLSNYSARYFLFQAMNLLVSLTQGNYHNIWPNSQFQGSMVIASDQCAPKFYDHGYLQISYWCTEYRYTGGTLNWTEGNSLQLPHPVMSGSIWRFVSLLVLEVFLSSWEGRRGHWNRISHRIDCALVVKQYVTVYYFELLTVQLELKDSNLLIQDESETENARSELKHIRNRKNFHDILRKLELNIEFEVKIIDSSIVQLHIPPIGIRYQK